MPVARVTLDGVAMESEGFESVESRQFVHISYSANVVAM